MEHWVSYVLDDEQQRSSTHVHILRRTMGLVTMSDDDIDAVLSNFTGQVRKRDGLRYPGKTIHEIITSLQKYFQIQGKHVRLIDINKFPTLYYALDVAMKQSATAGLGMDTRKALAISKEQECRLF